MSSFKFKGDFDILSDSQLKFVESVLQKQGFENGVVSVEPVGQKGDNYMANVKRFIFEKSDGTFFKMIGKLAPSSPELRSMMNAEIFFKNEIIMYNEFFPKLHELQDKAGVPECKKFRSPKCYGVLDREPEEFILMEDVGESSFEMLDRTQTLANEAIRLALEDLALFHSLSLVLKNVEPENYNHIKNRLRDPFSWMGEDSDSKMFFDANQQDLKALMDDEKYLNVISKLNDNDALVKGLEVFAKNSAYSVIVQGDCWSNNILFKLKNGKPEQSVMIDYQLSSEGSVCTDLLSVILNCSDHETRMQHYYKWLDLYHEKMDEVLRDHGMDSKQVYPRDQLDTDLKTYGKVMVGLAIFFASIIVRDPKDVTDLKEMGDLDKDKMRDALLSQKMTCDESKIRLKKRVIDIIDSAEAFELI